MAYNTDFILIRQMADLLYTHCAELHDYAYIKPNELLANDRVIEDLLCDTDIFKTRPIVRERRRIVIFENVFLIHIDIKGPALGRSYS